MDSSDLSARLNLRFKQQGPLPSLPSRIARLAISLPTGSTISNSPPRSALHLSLKFAICKVYSPKEMKKTKTSKPTRRDLSSNQRDSSSASSPLTKARTDIRRRTGILRPSCKSSLLNTRRRSIARRSLRNPSM